MHNQPNIVDFELFHEIKEFHTCFMLIDKKLPDTVLTEDLQIHFVELPKAEQFTGKLAELAQIIDKASPEMEEKMTVLIQKNPVYTEVYNRYTHCIEDEAARSKALSREKFERDVGSRLHNSFEKGKLEGQLEGKLETARILKSLNVPHEKIQEATSLSFDEIQKL